MKNPICLITGATEGVQSVGVETDLRDKADVE